MKGDVRETTQAPTPGGLDQQIHIKGKTASHILKKGKNRHEATLEATQGGYTTEPTLEATPDQLAFSEATLGGFARSQPIGSGFEGDFMTDSFFFSDMNVSFSSMTGNHILKKGKIRHEATLKATPDLAGFQGGFVTNISFFKM
ncbi:uncharacterized protein UTRI_00298 [Ustilago trichophora]|uniref:Uncharacterized protein n=1 Tax=Ustilago trichophora TaxID=86804 RepID=A0A5C3DUC5_9BASI|nr:uncharacterized protein UTRI_00298 [Ustilago trichophora]